MDLIWSMLPYLTAVGAILVIKKAVYYVNLRGRANKLKEKARKKKETEQEYIQQQIDKYEKELNQEDVDAVIKLNGPELLEEYKCGKLKPTDVLKAYIYQSCKVTKKLNCVTEIIKDCATTASDLSGKDACDLPLYGVPVSIKESLETKGAPSTMGWAKYLEVEATDDCVIAKVLKHCGAVPFAKTNVSQITLSFEGSNPIYGETSNPHNTDFVAGGSSSGEGSIIGSGASVLGIGTDTGGSIRGPSHLCGICGFKPTTGRLSNIGLIPPYLMTSVCTTVGPMARDIDTLVMAMRALCCDKMYELDPTVAPLKFNEELYNSKKPLRIGYFDDNGYLKPLPPCQRTVKMAKEALEGAGHTLVPFKLPDIEHFLNAVSKAVFADGGETCLKMMEDEVVDDRLMHLYKRWAMPRWIMKIYAAFLRMKSKRLADDLLSYAGGGDSSTYNCWQTRMDIEAYKVKFWAEWKEKHNLDALICPIYPGVACPKGSLVNTTALMCYTVFFNGINYPAGTLPISKVTQKDIDDIENYQGHYGDEWDEHLKKIAKKSIGMPIGVQCVSSPFKEEVCLRLMKEVETLLPMKKDQ